MDLSAPREPSCRKRGVLFSAMPCPVGFPAGNYEADLFANFCGRFNWDATRVVSHRPVFTQESFAEADPHGLTLTFIKYVPLFLTIFIDRNTYRRVKFFLLLKLINCDLGSYFPMAFWVNHLGNTLFHPALDFHNCLCEVVD
jgi:hypothetical protein